MTIHVTAVYEKGLLRPTASLPLEEGAQVEIIVLGPPREVRAAQAADILAAIAALPTSGGDTDPRELYPLLHHALHDEGWDDPHMDEYNRSG